MADALPLLAPEQVILLIIFPVFVTGIVPIVHDMVTEPFPMLEAYDDNVVPFT